MQGNCIKSLRGIGGRSDPKQSFSLLCFFWGGSLGRGSGVWVEEVGEGFFAVAAEAVEEFVLAAVEVDPVEELKGGEEFLEGFWGGEVESEFGDGGASGFSDGGEEPCGLGFFVVGEPEAGVEVVANREGEGCGKEENIGDEMPSDDGSVRGRTESLKPSGDSSPDEEPSRQGSKGRIQPFGEGRCFALGDGCKEKNERSKNSVAKHPGQPGKKQAGGGCQPALTVMISNAAGDGLLQGFQRRPAPR